MQARRTFLAKCCLACSGPFSAILSTLFASCLSQTEVYSQNGFVLAKYQLNPSNGSRERSIFVQTCPSGNDLKQESLHTANSDFPKTSVAGCQCSFVPTLCSSFSSSLLTCVKVQRTCSGKVERSKEALLCNTSKRQRQQEFNRQLCSNAAVSLFCRIV